MQHDAGLPTGGLLSAIATVVTSLGMSTSLILFYVWWSWKRDQTRDERMEKLEDFNRTTLIGLLEKTVNALTQDAIATENCRIAIDGCRTAIETNTKVLESVEIRNEDLKAALLEHHRVASEAFNRLEKHNHGSP